MINHFHLDDEQIIYYVYNLNWLLPKEVQQEAMEILAEPGASDRNFQEYR
jgi:hypothetical protein